MITLLAVTFIIIFVLNGRFSEQSFREGLISKELKAQTEKYQLCTDNTLIRARWGLILDRNRSQLLYLTIKARNLESQLLDLRQVGGCTILKSYNKPRSFYPLKDQIRKEYLESISLSIKYNDDYFQIPFFRYGTDKLSEMKMLASQARHWQRLIHNKLTQQ